MELFTNSSNTRKWLERTLRSSFDQRWRTAIIEGLSRPGAGSFADISDNLWRLACVEAARSQLSDDITDAHSSLAGTVKLIEKSYDWWLKYYRAVSLMPSQLMLKGSGDHFFKKALGAVLLVPSIEESALLEKLRMIGVIWNDQRVSTAFGRKAFSYLYDILCFYKILIPTSQPKGVFYEYLEAIRGNADLRRAGLAVLSHRGAEMVEEFESSFPQLAQLPFSVFPLEISFATRLNATNELDLSWMPMSVANNWIFSFSRSIEPPASVKEILSWV